MFDLPVQISALTATSCLGHGVAPMLDALRERRTGLQPCRFDTVDIPAWVGEVEGVDAVALPAALSAFDCRNNRLALLGLEKDDFAASVRAAIARHGAHRVGVILGTSTSGMLQTEIAYRQRDAVTGALPADYDYHKTHNAYSVAEFTRAYLGAQGPAQVISTACSSSAKAFASARRMLDAGLIDAAIVGGVDSLCLTTLYGFNSLELVSPRPCKPFDAQRQGISIGEAAAFALLERAAPGAPALLLLGAGESSDAHHMSSPHPEGLGARIAMQEALTRARLAPGDIDYINLHGTATQTNDAAEGKAVNAVFGDATPCSSTKGATGHTLGAAGALEAVVCLLALRHGVIPAGANTEARDPALHVNYVLASREATVRRAMSNSFGFGGTNCSLIFGYAS
jgi:3-oxoacyl-[acyl-carrier-protein] synthase-1